MTALSRLTKVGFAPEAVVNTWLTPSYSVPFTKADVEDVVAQIKDQSYRYNDTVLQGVYPGPAHATWSLDLMGYPDLMGAFLRGVVGPDVVTPALTTTLSAATLAGASSFSTVLTIPAGSIVQLDTGGNVEFALTGTPTGTGPYVIPVMANGPSGPVASTLALAHASAAAVTGQTTHTFKQNPAAAKTTYAFTMDDQTANPLGYNSAVISDFSLKIDPKAAVSMTIKLMSMPGLPQTTFVPVFASTASAPPILGWQWAMTNAGAASTRGLSLDYAVKRSVDVIDSSDGTQGPREIFQGPLEADFTYKAIFENNIDIGLYLNGTQQPATANLQQPVSLGGTSLAVTMTRSSWQKGKREWGGNYIEASYSGAGVFNATDGGALSMVMKNFHPGVY